MPFFRNPEIRLLLYRIGAFSLLAVCAAAVIFKSVPMIIFTAGVCLLFGGLFLAFTWRRYRAISELSAQLDRLLHGGGILDLTENEGELAVLRSEVYKLTVRLREQAARLEQDKQYLSDSLADISHQLRTPLTSLQLVASILQKEAISPGFITPERRLALVRELASLLDRMDWLVTTLLKVSQLDSGTVELQSEPVSVPKLVAKAAEPFLIPMELRGCRLQISQGEAWFRGDFAWSAEAIGNILKNSAEHIPEGGTVAISFLENPVCTEIVIEDDGPGIPPEELPHLFERFFRGQSAAHSGYGIGLAMARMVFARQNGTIKAANRSGDSGSRFIIRIYRGVV